MNNSSIIRFGVVGLISTLIDIGLLRLGIYLGINLYLATAIGFFAGLTNGFFLNSRFVFAQDYTSARYLKYGIVSLFALLWTELIIDFLHVRVAWTSAIGAKLVAVVVVFFWNYFLSKKWAFR